MVEYAPNQRAPKIWAKKDTREGTILQGNSSIYTTECKVVAPLLVRLGNTLFFLLSKFIFSAHFNIMSYHLKDKYIDVFKRPWNYCYF